MNRIGVGFVGAGWMGSVQLRRLSERPDVCIVGLFEPNVERGVGVLTELGLPAELLVRDYQQLVENPDVEAIWLVSPNSHHGPQAVAAMKAGKHVFCEKPPATTFTDFAREVELERANSHLITFVDYILYFDPMEQKLRRMAAEGEFGRLTQVQINYRHPINISGDKRWKLSRSIMGDAIGMGINHGVSVLVHLLAHQTAPVGVYATSLPAQVRSFEADPIWNIQIRFEDGACGLCLGNIDSGNGYDAYHNVRGTNGGFVFDSQTDQPRKVRYYSPATGDRWVYPLDAPRCRSEGFGQLTWPENITTPDSGNVVEHQTTQCVAHFLECVHAGRPSPLSFANSAIIGEIGWAAQMSAATRKEIPLPLDVDAAREFFTARG
ncbi:MAG TPA: hypothetical protein DCX07_13980 [Phycisphaerales bacterium]|nr:hypothetical protein [Phycisphaerales bacterium]